MYLSCSTLVCQLDEYPTIAEAVRRIQALGFQAIDLAAFERWQNVDPSWLVENYDAWAETFEKVLAETGMRVSSINAGPSVPITDPDPASFKTYTQEYLTLLKLAERVKCPNITIQPGKAEEGEEFEIVFERAKKRFQALAEFHRDKQITLSVEGHYGSLLENPEAALRMMKTLWPAVGFTYDPSHFTMQGIALQETQPLLDYTHHVHVRNASLGNMQETMEQGLVDIPWVISALRTSGV